jgi:glycosyltransferase involved in cell wall biosynthesis
LSKNKEILLLTSEKNFSWFSMTEIIPGIKSLWEKYCLKNNIKLNIINVDNTDVKELLTTSLNIDHIVMTCFNMKISWALKIIRLKFGVDAPFSLYVHGMATTGLWPLSHWEWNNLLIENDSFIVNCSKDVNLLNSKFPFINVKNIPFISSSLIKVDDRNKGEPFSFYYAGRISEQKNLHSLILAFSEYVKKDPESTLNIFGEEDFLGSPNMNVESRECKKYLLSLVNKLKIENSVKFHGFVPREEIANILGDGKKVFISMSLHSDENFGMAALHALNSGHSAILTDWGGYSDFKSSYPESVELIPVSNSSRGPCVNIDEILKAMKECRKLESKTGQDKYDIDHVINLLPRVFINNHKRVADFTFAKSIASKRIDLNSDDNSSWVFEDYSDSCYLEIASFYSSEVQKEIGKIDFTRAKIVPWVEISNSSLKVDDPHKGMTIIQMTNIIKYTIDGVQLDEHSFNFLKDNQLLYYEN